MAIASDKMVNYIKVLLEQRQVAAEHRLKLEQLLTDHAENEIFMTGKLAWDTIEWLKRRPQIAEVPTFEPVDVGAYRYEKEIYVVKWNKAKTHRYAMKLVVIKGERVLEDDTVVDFDYVYAPGVMNHLTRDLKLTLAEGESLSIKFGRCIYCHRRLKAAKSVLAGIGPACRKLYA